MWKKIPDSFLLGMLGGAVTLVIFYSGLAYIRSLVTEYYSDPYRFVAPRVQLFTIFLNIVVFRFVIIKADKEKFGKGIFLITILASFVYFYYYLRFHQSIVGS